MTIRKLNESDFSNILLANNANIPAVSKLNAESLKSLVEKSKRAYVVEYNGNFAGFCIILGITAWNGYTYFVNRDGGAADTEIIIANPRYQSSVVGQALKIFETKSVEFDAIAVGVVPETPAPLIVEPESATSTATTTPELVAEEVSESEPMAPTSGVGLAPELNL